jgi:iron complex transport system substrate-binding protein
MKARVIPATIIILLVVVSGIYFCMPDRQSELSASADTNVYPGYPKSIVDSAGRNITIYKPLERIIVTNSNAAEAVRVVGADDRVIGITNSLLWHPTFFPQMSKLPVVGRWSCVDLELVLQMNADAIIAYKADPSPSYLENKLPPTITVLRFDFFKPETLREEMIKLGYLLDEGENTSKYIKWHDKYVNEIEGKTSAMPADKKPIVFLNNDFDDSKTERRTYARTADSIGAYPILSLEYIYEENPDVIVGLSYRGGYGKDSNSGMKAEYEAILDLQGFDQLSAVKNKRVYIIDSSTAYSPGYPSGLADLAKWFYPDDFVLRWTGL